MNNNRNNNRRRGRGNRNQGGGGNQANRIDSRARGNAPQLLEKYKKLAQDAQHNGDRVQAEYYLQFADHYFRVLADNKSRQDETRGRRPDDRDGDDESDGEEFDSRRRSDTRNARSRRDDREDRDDRRDDRYDARDRDENAGADDSAYEPAENPFVVKDEDDRRPRRAPRKPRQAANGDGDGFDIAALPPSIGAREDAADDGKPAPRRRRRKPDESDTVRAVG